MNSLPVGEIIQPRLYLTVSARAGMATGSLFRDGGVIRYVGTNRFHSFLKDAPDQKETAQELLRRVAAGNTRLLAPTAVAAAVAVTAVAAWGYTHQRDKNRPAPEVTGVEASLLAYIDAGQHGALDVDVIDHLIRDLDALKSLFGDDPSLNLPTDPFLEDIAKHTRALAQAYSSTISTPEIEGCIDHVAHLRDQLAAQRAIINDAA